jgi:hypothetical protein
LTDAKIMAENSHDKMVRFLMNTSSASFHYVSQLIYFQKIFLANIKGRYCGRRFQLQWL